MKFFFDNNLSPKLAKALNCLVEPQHKVVHLISEFEPNCEDAVWMRSLAGQTDLIIVTANARIGKNSHAVRAWQEAGHTIFFLKPGWLGQNSWTQAYKFAKCFPDIIEKASRARPDTAFSVQVNGKIKSM